MKSISRVAGVSAAALVLLFSGAVATTSGANVTTQHYSVEGNETYRQIAAKMSLNENALTCANLDCGSDALATESQKVTRPGPGRIIHLTSVVVAPTTTSSVVPSTSVVPSSTTTTPATTTPATTTPPTTTPPTTTPPGTRFGNLAVGATMPSEANCASRVRSAAEIRPANRIFNATRGTNNGAVAGVTGNYVGTTDEILQWASCKWGIDEDWVRAQAATESYWMQNAHGDYGSNLNGCAPEFRNENPCPESIGIVQVRFSAHARAFDDRNAIKSTAYNVDYLYSIMRSCYNGDLTWLNTVERGSQYAAGDMWGCFGVWFSGRWHTSAANTYISFVQNYLAQREWTKPAFVNYGPGQVDPGGTPPSTTAPATTAAATTLPTTTTTTPPGGTAGCGLAAAAFCETFNSAYTGAKTQTGDLDPVLWGVSRVAVSNPGQGLINSLVMSHNACANGAASPVPSDVRICNGQFVGSQNDGGGVTSLDTYPKQPFDFAGRTGKVVFDVSADSEGTHAAWPEFVITDEPVPGTRGEASQSNVPARNSVGFALASNNVDHIWVSANGVYSEVPVHHYGSSMTKGSRTAMNHIEVMVSTTRIDIWGTNAGSTALIHLAGADLNLNFSRGLVWLNDVHYNARKAIEPCGCGTQYDHSFAWDNLGFDGPKTYRDWGFDVPLANVANTAASQSGDPTYVQTGYRLSSPRALQVTGVNKGVATSAKVVLNTSVWYGDTLSLSVNGNPTITHSLGGDFGGQSFSMPVPLSQIVNGTNTLTFSSDDGSNTAIFNITLIMVAAAPVP